MLQINRKGSQIGIPSGYLNATVKCFWYNIRRPFDQSFKKSVWCTFSSLLQSLHNWYIRMQRVLGYLWKDYTCICQTSRLGSEKVFTAEILVYPLWYMTFQVYVNYLMLHLRLGMTFRSVRHGSQIRPQLSAASPHQQASDQGHNNNSNNKA